MQTTTISLCILESDAAMPGGEAERSSEVVRLTVCMCLCVFLFHSVTVPQSQTDPQAEQKASPVHLASLRRQHRPADHDPYLAQLSGGLHQQLTLQLCS